jgi:hypothetical protein
MKALDEHGHPIIHIEDPDAGNERERWVMIMGSDGSPESLVQQYVTTGARASGSPHVRAVRAIPADDFGPADLSHEVRHKLYEFLEEQKTPKT